MCCKSFWTRAVPFALAIALSLFVNDIFHKFNYSNRSRSNFTVTTVETIGETRPEMNNIIIFERPAANYTSAAREHSIVGTVTLKVTFLPNGKIGAIDIVKGLDYGLTEQAISAARNIKFQPATLGGNSIPATKILEYSFMIY